MSLKILIVEDELIVAKDLKMILERSGHVVIGIAPSVKKSLELIGEQEPEMVILDIHLKGELTGIHLAENLNERSIPFVYLSANSNQKILEQAKETKPYGFMIKPFREEEVLIAIDIAQYRHRNSLEAELRKKNLLVQELNRIRESRTDYLEQLSSLCRAVQSHVPFDFIEFGILGNPDTGKGWCGFQRIGYDEYRSLEIDDIIAMSGLNRNALANLVKKRPKTQQSESFREEGFQQLVERDPIKGLFAKLFHLNAALDLTGPRESRASQISFYSSDPSAYGPRQLEILAGFQDQLLQAIKSIGQVHEKNPVHTPGKVPQNDKHPEFPGIIGHSQALLSVLDYVRHVSIVDTSVLIFGETGTGKEQIAHVIHLQSSRRNMPFIRVNCAALPFTLIESELFGYEKGAFTGASVRKAGKFELAQNGTIFLDEIGEIPIEVQVKLLRVLQEREIDRLGGTVPVKINVRIIAATNKNLEKEVAEARFRMDLYYRLNVFPIQLPPLRARREDIPELCRHFISLYSKLHHKAVSGISSDCLQQLMAYNWPGNIRELENIIERSLVLCQAEMITKVYLPDFYSPFVQQSAGESDIQTIDDIQRTHIQSVLEKCKHRIYGAGGAAEMLGMPATTLNSKIKKLGISRKPRKS